MKYAFVVIQTILCLFSVGKYVVADVPNFVSGNGITVRSVSKVNNELYDVIITSGEVRGDQKIRILLPHDYMTSGSKRRYPVLYLLHGGMGGADDWTAKGGTARWTVGNLPLITVMPNGDPFGWYTNWVNPGNAAPQNWRTFHNEKLIPWIDANLRTVAKKQGRAIAGLSMGGFGAIRYAEVYPHLYNYAASFSGALDLLDWRTQTVILGSETIDKKPLNGPFGTPYLPWTSSGWFAQNPITHAATLRDVHVAIYTGNQGIVESTMRDAAIRMHNMLNSLNIPHHYNDYGNGKSIGHNCPGRHEFSCWNAALIDVAPRMMAVLEQKY
ncbi:unnamed protein product [Adineta ricciae]|uniref:Esterase n=1 Tax=Adineta ricciae TaxID=249248 RepID=A0A814MMA2_ADIRI|nr:unnamed protein product [Adineta ricciae]CAF1351760.1 unnamed protein product [Adineta ricciae]